MKTTTPLKLSNRLIQYSALTVAIAGITDANGQVDYTPNFNGVGGPGFYILDLNNDLINDFVIGGGYFANYVLVFGYGNNSFLGSPSSYAYPLALNPGDLINAAQSRWFDGYYSGTLNFSSCYGGTGGSNWCGVTDKYLGLRFDIGGNTHYGWVRLDVDYSGANWVIKDYAYEQTSGVGISAGDGLLGLEDNVFSKVKIVALNKSIALFNLPQNTNYRLFSLTGQSVLDGKIDNDTYVIEANTLATGVYIVELKDNNTKAIIRKKIVL